MDEISLFKILRPAPPAAEDEIAQAVRDRLDQAMTAPPARCALAPRGRHARLVLAGALSLALAAGAAAVAVAGHGGSPHGTGHGGSRPGIAVRELAYKIAAVAAAQPGVRPGQWEYWKERLSGGSPDEVFQVWTTADDRRAAYLDDNGKVQYFDFCHRYIAGSSSCGQFIGQPEPPVVPLGSAETGTMPVGYAGLGALPRTPEELVAHLGDLRFPHWRGWGPAPVREFLIIERMLITYVMPPALTAELYRALAHIPGVTVDRHAVDVAGRPGIGLSIDISPGGGGGIEEIIIDPATHQLAGHQLLTSPPAGSASKVESGTAILRHAPVSGPGQPP
jgi:hypothetical protein